jgi:hypothetical protein
MQISVQMIGCQSNQKLLDQAIEDLVPYAGDGVASTVGRGTCKFRASGFICTGGAGQPLPRYTESPPEQILANLPDRENQSDPVAPDHITDCARVPCCLCQEIGLHLVALLGGFIASRPIE